MYELFCQSFLLFLLYIAAHLIFCRWNRRQFFARAIFIFIIFAIGSAVHALSVYHWPLLDTLIYELIFYFLWALYVIVLVNAQNSFSLGALQILLKRKNENAPISPTLLFPMESSLEKRLEILKINGLIIELPKETAETSFQLTSKGQRLAKAALFLRRILRISDVG